MKNVILVPKKGLNGSYDTQEDMAISSKKLHSLPSCLFFLLLKPASMFQKTIHGNKENVKEKQFTW